MGEYSEAFVAFDVSKTKHAVAIVDGGRGSEVRFLGEVANTPTAVERLIRKLAGRYRASLDPEAAGRASQDQLAGCGDAGPAAPGR